MLPNQGPDPILFADSVRALLSENPLRYRNFGVYWFFVKALLKRRFDRRQMPMLGDYEDPSVVERMPPGADAHALMALAIEEYALNAGMNMGRSRIEDPHGEMFTLLDTDVEG